ncbi:hypothetical protein Nepgr_018450 [Nepenthes gracilis]|uniref:Protein MULTIPOLAR SPINDLE 1 n=1 Tax=Nepenthes gracilis TaxID=150966 RepID=A0AAD3STK8_NEPGR|nr:hypothetical protein Nepgr_018450 [Nepenthes gracilis]
MEETTATAATSSDESMKLAIAMALLRSKLVQKPPPTSSSSSSIPLSDAQRWKRKAKDRKREILRLKEDIKELEDGLHCDLYPQSASCKCYFFNNLGKLSPKQITESCDHRLNDVLHRRFLRRVRLHERRKRRANDSIQHLIFSGFNSEDEMEQLKVSVDFLVDICNKDRPVEGDNFANLVHQAVDFILEQDSCKIYISSYNLIVRLVRRMCILPLDEQIDSECDMRLYVQHLIRKLSSMPFIGQRVILSVSQRISELAENLLFLDPFDESFPCIHASMFVLIQLIEFLVSDYLLDWSNDEGFDNGLFKDWVQSVLDARKSLELLESRAGLYILYMDRVTGELARQVGRISSLQSQNPDILDLLLHH